MILTNPEKFIGCFSFLVVKSFFTSVSSVSSVAKIIYLAPFFMATESAHEGYLVIFDTRTHAGAVCKPQYHGEEDKKVITFIIGIGKNPMKK
jgi:hypothetical protein